METRRRNPRVAGAPLDRLAKTTAIREAAVEKKVPALSAISARVHAPRPSSEARARLRSHAYALPSVRKLVPSRARRMTISESFGCSRGAPY